MKKKVSKVNRDQITSPESSEIASAAYPSVLTPTSGTALPTTFELAVIAATVFGNPGANDPEDAVSIGWQIWNKAESWLHLSKTRLETAQESRKRFMENGHRRIIIDQLTTNKKLPIYPDRWTFTQLAKKLLPHAVESAQMLRGILNLPHNFDVNSLLEAFILEYYAITFVQLSIEKHEREKSEFFSALSLKKKPGKKLKPVTESDFSAIFTKEFSPWRI